MSDVDDPLSKGWYFRKAGKVNGPLARQRVQAMIESRELLADAEVWHPTLSSWQVAANHFHMPRPVAPVVPKPAPAPIQRASFNLGHDLDRPDVEPPPAGSDASDGSDDEYPPDTQESFALRAWHIAVAAAVALLLLVWWWPKGEVTAPATARGTATDGELQIQVDATGVGLEVNGPLNTGAADKVIGYLRLRPALTTLILNSEGGPLEEGYRLGQFMAQRPGASVRVRGRCSGACVVALLSVPQRQIAWDAQIRFEPVSRLHEQPGQRGMDQRATERYRTLLLDAGLPGDFVHQAMNPVQGQQALAPELAKLLETRVVQVVVDGGRSMDRSEWQSRLLERQLAGARQSEGLRELLDVLQRNDLDLHAAVVAALFPVAGPDGRVAKPLSEPEVMSKVVDGTLLRASDQHIVAWLDARLDQLRYLRDQRRFAECVTYLAGRDLSPGVDPDLHLAEFRAVAAMVEDARGRPSWRVDVPAAEQDRASLEQAAAEFHEARFGNRGETTPQEDEQIHCRVRTEYHDRWIRLPTARAANLARARLAQ